MAGATRHPHSAWVTQQARNLSFDLTGQGPFGLLIRDRDSKYTRSFDAVFAADGMRIVLTPFRAPRANAFAERWVRTVRRECLDWTLVFGRRHLEHVLRFMFWQILGTNQVDGRFELYTRNYAYRLTMTNDRQPFVRWEYFRPQGIGQVNCRHHLQGPIELKMGQQTASLDGFHLPTGWVTFEEVARFCIVDLEVPPRRRNWNRLLLNSYEKFKKEFAPLGQV